MRILHTVEAYPPAIGGMAEVVRQLSERLGEKGHAVTVATSVHPGRSSNAAPGGVRVEEFGLGGNLVVGIQGDCALYERFLLESDFDVIVNFAAQQWATDLALPLLPKIKGRKVLVPTGFPALCNPSYASYYSQMGEWLRSYDELVFLSKGFRDYKFAEERGMKNLHVIPNGADEREFAKLEAGGIRDRLRIPERHLLILLVGSHTGLKGHREAMEIFRRTRVPNAALLIVGNDTGEGCGERCARRAARFGRSPLRLMDGKSVVLADLSRAQVLAAYAAADVFLFPSNLECSPLVIFEAMAAGLPFLSTAVGNVEDLAAYGGGLLLPGVSDDLDIVHASIGPSAKALTYLASDRAKREEMGRAGRSAWEAHFTWDRIVGMYERLYEGIGFG